MSSTSELRLDGTPQYSEEQRSKLLDRMLALPDDWQERLKDPQLSAELIISMLPDDAIGRLRKLKEEGSFEGVRFGTPEFWQGLLVHTEGHIDCPACGAAEGILKADLLGMANMPLPDAAKLWLRWRKQDPKLKPRTHETCRDYLNACQKFFGKIALSSITAGMLRSYQKARRTNSMMTANGLIQPWKRTAAPSRINQELACLTSVLHECGLWEKQLEPFYYPLAVSEFTTRPPVLTEEEEEHLFRAAAGYPECHLAYCCAVITNNTTASGMELRGIKLKHVFLYPTDSGKISFVQILEGKNLERIRSIPLNRTARWAVEMMYARAIKLGCSLPDHYLFPRRNRNHTYDPTKPPTRWFLQNSWDHLRELTGFDKLRPHDLRHQAITRMLEEGQTPENVQAVAGHVGKKMMDFYSHQRIRTKFAAVHAIEPSFEMVDVFRAGRQRASREVAAKKKSRAAQAHNRRAAGFRKLPTPGVKGDEG